MPVALESEIRPTQPIGWREMEVDLDKTIRAALELRPELRRDRSNLARTTSACASPTTACCRSSMPSATSSPTAQSGLRTQFRHDVRRHLHQTTPPAATGVPPSERGRHRFQFKQAGTRKAQSEEQLRDLQDQITMEVRQAVRDLRTSRDRISITQSQNPRRRVKLAAETRRYEVGISTAYTGSCNSKATWPRPRFPTSGPCGLQSGGDPPGARPGDAAEDYGVQVAGAEINSVGRAGFFIPIGLK